MVKTSASRNDVAHDDVFLKPTQVVDPGASGCFREHAGGVLERCSTKEALRFQRGLGDTEQNGLSFSGFATHLFDSLILFLELEFIGLLTPQERGIAGFGDTYLAEHLANDDLDVFVVNGNTLQPVNFLHFVNQELLKLLRAANIENLVRINWTFR